MSSPNPFKPPAAPVADVGEPWKFAGPARVALGVLTTIQLVIFGLWSVRRYVVLVDVGTLSPIGLMTLLGGLLCLYVGVARLLITRRFGARLLLASVILQVGTLLLWHGFLLAPWHLGGAVLLLVPLLLGFGLAIWGWVTARTGARTSADPLPRQGATR